ncbi:MAG: HAMP domain-containing histidine kinase [Leptospira sp.]|nr:HAMP domain-containing histidine kinase [Leptospira sp.]
MNAIDNSVEVDMEEFTDRIEISGENWEDLIQKCEFNYNHKIEIFDIKNLVYEIASQFTTILRSKNITLDIESNSILFLKLDREKMKLILRHIMRNAIFYSYKNGKVKIRIIEDQGYCNIAIEDEGVGISDNILPTIFPNSDSTVNNFELASFSKNIGLSQCKDWIIEMGGSVSIQSNLGQGTIVYLSIPTLNIVDDKKP